MLKNILICKLFNLDLLDVALNKYNLNQAQNDELQQKLVLLNSGVPLDYVVGKVKILDLELIVNRHTLIPREETEFWLKQFKNYIQKSCHLERSERSYASIRNAPKVSNFTTSQYLSDIYDNVDLLDVEKETLKVTKHNIEQNNKTNCQAILSDGLQDIEKLIGQNEKWDLIANLPYLPIADINKAKEYKVEHEPVIALYSGNDGLELFNKVLNQIKTMANKPINVVFELDPRNIKQAKLNLNKLNYQTEIWLDQNGMERVLVGVWIILVINIHMF
jgi:release factor glutamine methyltransferase